MCCCSLIRLAVCRPPRWPQVPAMPCSTRQPCRQPASSRQLPVVRGKCCCRSTSGSTDMTTEITEIRLYAAAPEKPVVGAPCNGCGVCCSLMPCPLSRWLLRHCRGSCPALTWLAEEQRYGCGLVIRPAAFLTWLPPRWAGFARLFARRWIAVGVGCDCDAEPAVSSPKNKEPEV